MPATSTPAPNREDWLTQLAERLNVLLFGSRMPKYRVSCSWPSRGATARRNKVVGQCFYPDSSTDKTTEIFISPYLADPIEVAGTLAHEMVHAIVGAAAGHGKPFRELALEIGLTGPMRSTGEGPKFIEAVKPVLEKIGAYPHATLNASAKVAKQSTRLKKASCSCGYTVRITKKWLDEVGNPHCPLHGEMEVD